MKGKRKHSLGKLRWLPILYLTIVTIFVSSCSKTDETNDNISINDNLLLKSLGDTILPYCRQGDSVLIEYLKSNYEYPSSALKDQIEGRILVLLTVNADSTISGISILHGLQTDCDNEALELFENMPDWWNPATVRGIPVTYTIVFPLMLKLQ